MLESPRQLACGRAVLRVAELLQPALQPALQPLGIEVLPSRQEVAPYGVLLLLPHGWQPDVGREAVLAQVRRYYRGALDVAALSDILDGALGSGAALPHTTAVRSYLFGEGGAAGGGAAGPSNSGAAAPASLQQLRGLVASSCAELEGRLVDVAREQYGSEAEPAGTRYSTRGSSRKRGAEGEPEDEPPAAASRGGTKWTDEQDAQLLKVAGQHMIKGGGQAKGKMVPDYQTVAKIVKRSVPSIKQRYKALIQAEAKAPEAPPPAPTPSGAPSSTRFHFQTVPAVGEPRVAGRSYLFMVVSTMGGDVLDLTISLGGRCLHRPAAAVPVPLPAGVRAAQQRRRRDPQRRWRRRGPQRRHCQRCSQPQPTAQP